MKKLIRHLTLTISKYFFPFYNSKDIKLLFKNLEKDETKGKEVAMFVGGCVRNHLQSKKIEDIDIATILTPDEVKKKLEHSKFKIIDTGVEHGSVTVVIENKKFELTTLRKDIRTDGRHAEIETIDNWKEDSNRRDFTINAIYLNKKGKIFDPQQGINDLNNKVIKFIGDPQTRIEEDFLRIIRFLRFSIQYNSSVEQTTVKAIKLQLNGIKNLSKERVLSELQKILKLENFLKLINNKELLEIFCLVFPEFKKIDRLKNFSLIKNQIENSEILLLAILLVDLKSNHEYFSHKYKVSKKTHENLYLLGNKFRDSKLDKEFFKKKLKNNLYEIGLKNLKILFCLNLLDKKKITSKEINFFQVIEKILIPKFPFDGKFLIKKGIQEGKKIGKILKEAERFWVQNDFNLSSEDIETIIKKNSSIN
tara:strand:- start:1701 stop:2966 length:1266 start_codon:yes stop_codon:yes gene_type:complete